MAKAYFDVWIRSCADELLRWQSVHAEEIRLRRPRQANSTDLAAKHARSQAPAGCYVIGSVGPTGEFLEPLGEVSESEMYDAFVEQITALDEGGADGVVIETMTAVEEAALAIKAAREHTSLAVIATMTFDKGPARLLHHDGGDAGAGG